MMNVVEEHKVLEHRTIIVAEQVSESAPCEVVSMENTERSDYVGKSEDYGMKDDDILSEVSEMSQFGSQNIDEKYKRLIMFWT